MARERRSRGKTGERGIKSRQEPFRGIESLRGTGRAKTPYKALDSVPKARGGGKGAQIGERRRGVGIGDHENKGIASRRYRSPGRHNNRFRPQHNGRRQRSRSHYGRNYRSRLHLGFGLGFGGRYYPRIYRRWIPGYYQTHTEEVLVEPGHYEWQSQRTQVEPGRYEIQQIPAVEEIRRDEQGKEHKVVLEPARSKTVWVPPKYEERKVKVWVADRYETRDVQVWVPGYWVTDRSY